MKNYLVITIALLAAFAAGCNTTGTPVQYAGICDKANDDKYVEVVGFLDNSGSSMCSSGYGNPMRCPIKFKDSLESEKWINAELDKGTGPSSVDEYEKGKGLKITDDKGGFVERADKVKITAEVKVFDSASTVGDPDPKACYVVVKKVEKQ